MERNKKQLMEDKFNNTNHKNNNLRFALFIKLLGGCLGALHVVVRTAKDDRLAHELQRSGWWPASLAETQASLDALQELSCDLVAHDMRSVLVVCVQLLAGRSLVDTDHGDTNRPCTEKRLASRTAEDWYELTYALPILSRR